LPFKKMKKGTLSEKIVEEIERLIADGEIKPGTMLPSERELAEKLGVSRPPIREALHSLKALGLVDIKGGGGAYLKTDVDIISDHFKIKSLLAEYNALELIEARAMLEAQTVALAIQRGTEEDLAEIKAAADKCAAYDNASEARQSELDFDFHLAIAEASHNSVLSEMLKTTRALMLNINALNVREPGHKELSDRFHASIFQAIKNGREKAAVKMMREHISTITSGLDYFLAQGNFQKPPA